MAHQIQYPRICRATNHTNKKRENNRSGEWNKKSDRECQDKIKRKIRGVWKKMSFEMDFLHDEQVKQGNEISVLRETINRLTRIVMEQAHQLYELTNVNRRNGRLWLLKTGLRGVSKFLFCQTIFLMPFKVVFFTKMENQIGDFLNWELLNGI